MKTMTICLPELEAAMLEELKRKKIDYSSFLAASIRSYFQKRKF